MKKIISIVLIIVAVYYLGSNLLKNKEDSETIKQSMTGTISVEKTIPVANVKIGPMGGKVLLEDKTSPIAGLEIDIPANSYKEDREFKVSYGPVLDHTFGEDFNPITPLISVDNGGGYSDDFMNVKIPVKVPADSFAMGFIYDAKTNTLEGLPIIFQDENSITVGTRHFTDIIISSIPLLKLKADIDTGFRPGIDDWQFVNRGSYIAPGGHCAGQSLSALWYYSIQPDGKDLTLYDRYDNNGEKPATPNLWEDDNLGYRFASTIQNDIDWDGFAFKLWKAQRGVDDDLTWKLFSYSMQLTGEPQLVGLTKEGVGGHAMVAYRIKDNEIYIADPNYPGDLTRRIKFVNGKIEPYESGANFDEIKKGNSISFDKVGFTGKTTVANWAKISERWAEFKDKTIGKDRFPFYKIIGKDKDGKEYDLNDGDISSEKFVNLYTFSARVTAALVYRDGKNLERDALGNIELLKGNNKLGFSIWGTVNDEIKYIDFKYVNVVYEPKEAGAPIITSVSPNPAKVGDTITISGSNLGEGPLGKGLNYSSLVLDNNSNYGPISKTVSWTNDRIVFVLKRAPESDSTLYTGRGELKFKINMTIENTEKTWSKKIETMTTYCSPPDKTVKDSEYTYYRDKDGQVVKDGTSILYFCARGDDGLCDSGTAPNQVCSKSEYKDGKGISLCYVHETGGPCVNVSQ